MIPTGTNFLGNPDFRAPLYMSVIIISLSLMGWLVKSWINSVNKRLDILFELMKNMSDKREIRWNKQDELCRNQEGRIARMEGKLNNKIGPVGPAGPA